MALDYDFIEIGTSVYETLISRCSDSTVGMSVEPIKKYLDKLPDKPNVVKVNAAITSNKTSEDVNIFYIPDDIIDENGWPEWLKGCNSINTYHGQHYGKENYVKIDKVPLMNVEELLVNNNVRGIQHLKIDTEGHDCVILKGLFDYIVTKSQEYYPKKIEFESNLWTNPKDVDLVISLFKILGYGLISRGHDTILELGYVTKSSQKVVRQNGLFKFR